MSDLCTYCGFTVDPACGGCGSDPQYWDKGPVRDAALDAVRAWRDAGTEGAKAAGTLDGCPYCDESGVHWCDGEVLRDELGDRIPMNAPDMVNHPPHYTTGAVECIDAIRAALGDDGMVAYCRGNAIKYLWRTGKKGDAVQDMEKAVWYITKAVEVAREDR